MAAQGSGGKAKPEAASEPANLKQRLKQRLKGSPGRRPTGTPCRLACIPPDYGKITAPRKIGDALPRDAAPP